LEQQPNIVPPRRTEPLAVGSLVLGILGLVTGLALILSPIALAMGIRAKQRIAASGGTMEGYGIAQAGFVLGVIGTVIAGLFVLFLGFCLVAVSSSGSM
jgi:hypothetical protein